MNEKNKFRNYLSSLEVLLFDSRYSFWIMMTASVFIIFFLLGAKDLWTQESRWANICQQMLIRHDYFHPFLDDANYYDKPLLSYWLILGFSWIFTLGRWALRLPGAVAGVLAVWATYKTAEMLSGKRTALLAGWMLTSTFFFIFWSRVASADILNVAGIMLAIAWYLKRRGRYDFITYIVLFLIIVFAALCKGLVAPVVVFLVLVPIFFKDRSWLKHINVPCILTMIICIALYIIPFYISSVTNTESGYKESGLMLVFQENVVRYFKPFDHAGPLYTYFLYLPAYTAPWIIFTIAGLYFGIKKWKTLEFSTKFYILGLVLNFLFFTLSGSRRSYYVLPMVPLAILIAADWVNSSYDKLKFMKEIAALLTVVSFVVILIVNIVSSAGYLGGGEPDFADKVRTAASAVKPWNKWKITFAGVKEKIVRNVIFYMEFNNLPEMYQIKERNISDEASFIRESRINPSSLPSDRILIIQKMYFKYLSKNLPQDKYLIIKSVPTYGDRILMKREEDSSLVAIIPAK